MGCQLESQGAALKELQNEFASKGVLLCGLDRIEHPYDVEDYLRHFGFTFPVFVDMCDESPAVARASLGSIAILGPDRQRLRVGGKSEFEPVEAKAALQKLLASSPGGPNSPARPPQVLRRAVNSRNISPPEVVGADWSKPVRLGTGKYPRTAAMGEGKAICVWVTGEVPHQQLEYALCTGGQWTKSRPIPAGQDAHAPALDVGSDGRPVLVWAQKGPECYRICLSRWLGNEWQEPVAISPAGNDAFRPDMFCLASGRTVVAWYGWKRVDLKDYPNSWWRSIYVCEVADAKPAGTCELAKLLRGSDDCWDPVITGAGDGTDLRVWWLRDENPPKLWVSAKGAAEWSPPTSLLQAPASVTKGFRVQAAAPIRSPAGRRALISEMNLSWGPRPFLAGTHLYLTRSTTNGWAAPIAISSLPVRHAAPVGVEVGSGTNLVFWAYLPGEGKPAVIRMRTANATGQLSVERAVVRGDYSNLYPAAAIDKAGTVWLAWQSEESRSTEAIYISSWRSAKP